MLPAPPSPRDTVTLAHRFLELCSGSFPGFDLLRDKFAGNDRKFARQLDAIHLEWWAELWSTLRAANAHMSDAEQHDAWARVMGDAEAGTLLANYVEDAYREPIERRRKMLQHAVAGLFDLSLAIDELARVWRAIRSLSPDDVMVLYALWLIPQRSPVGQGDPRARYWEASGAEALDGVAVRIRPFPLGGLGSSTGTINAPLEMRATGLLILRALRSFIATQPRPSNIPGHEVRDDFRVEVTARELLNQTGLPTLLAKYKNHAFSDRVQFDGVNVAGGAPAEGKAKLVLRRFQKVDEAELLRVVPRREGIEFGQHVSDFFTDHVGPAPDDAESLVVHVCGPHDVMRFLAYDLNAWWA